MRVSGGHLCEAEAPTEPAGETAVRRADKLSLTCHCERLRRRKKRATAGAAVKSCLRSKRKQLLDTARVSKPRGNPFLHTLVIARGFSPVAIRSLSRGLRILSRFAFRMTSRLGIANTYGVRLYFRLPVIAIDFAAFAPLVIASEQSERDNPFPRGNPLPALLHNGFSLPYK